MKRFLYEGEHEAIIDDDTWNRTREIMKANLSEKDLTKKMKTDIPLRCIAYCGHCNTPMVVTYTRKKSIRYYYYSCSHNNESTDDDTCPVKKIPSELLEDFAKSQLSKIFKSKEVLKSLTEKTGFAPRVILDIFYENFWANVTKAELTRMVHLLLDRITVSKDHVDIDIKYGGLKSIEKEFTKNEC